METDTQDNVAPSYILDSFTAENGTRFELVTAGAGYEPAGSGRRWTDGYHMVRWICPDGTRGGNRFKLESFEDARRQFVDKMDRHARRTEERTRVAFAACGSVWVTVYYDSRTDNYDLEVDGLPAWESNGDNRVERAACEFRTAINVAAAIDDEHKGITFDSEVFEAAFRSLV